MKLKIEGDWKLTFQVFWKPKQFAILTQSSLVWLADCFVVCTNTLFLSYFFHKLYTISAKSNQFKNFLPLDQTIKLERLTFTQKIDYPGWNSNGHPKNVSEDKGNT